MAGNAKEEVLDVAVVGGGIAGVYSAWRLMESQKMKGKKNISVFELSDRIGGRLLSVRPPGMPNTVCELGGMRYLSNQTYVKSLIEHKLRLKTKPQDVDEPNNIAFLRRTHMRLSEMRDSAKIPYDLSWAEQGRSPNELLPFALEQLIPGFSNLKGNELKKMLQTYKFEGKYLYQYGFWNLLARTLSREAYQFTTKAGGYDVTTQNWNAYDTIILNFDFSPGVTYRMLQNGYEEVPHKIAGLFEEKGGKIRKNHKLLSFDDAQKKGKKVTRLIFDTGNGQTKTVYAKSVILAMPRRSLELIEPSGSFLGDTKVQKLIKTVTPIPLFKVFVAYRYPWWESVGVSKGRSVTDLPLRQCYYWGTEDSYTQYSDSSRNSVLMATYDDGESVNFWAGLQEMQKNKEMVELSFSDLFGSLFSPEMKQKLKQMVNSEDHVLWDAHKAPKAMVDELHRQLKKLHGLKFVPEYYSAAYKNWGEDPYGGGVNFWNIGVKSWEVIPKIVQPKKNKKVYICGEAYSNGQGWVEGSLETAELVLQDHYGLEPPAWLVD